MITVLRSSHSAAVHQIAAACKLAVPPGKLRCGSSVTYKLKEVSLAFKNLLHSKFVGKTVVSSDRTLDDLRSHDGLIHGGQGALGMLLQGGSFRRGPRNCSSAVSQAMLGMD